MVGTIFQNIKTKKFYYVYRTAVNPDNTTSFVQFYQVRNEFTNKKVNKDKYYTELMSTFYRNYIPCEDLPPPIPKNIR